MRKVEIVGGPYDGHVEQCDDEQTEVEVLTNVKGRAFLDPESSGGFELTFARIPITRVGGVRWVANWADSVQATEAKGER